MEAPLHEMRNLFAQLGLPSDEKVIRCLIASHKPLSAGVLLSDAPFWSPAQVAFLREGTLIDADGSDMIDKLDEVLHG